MRNHKTCFAVLFIFDFPWENNKKEKEIPGDYLNQL